MRLCNETITVVNSRHNPETDRDEYTGTVIKGVSWHCEIASTVDGSGLKSANKFSIRIPTDADFNGRTYVDPITYSTGDNSDMIFTLKNGDLIVRGAVTTAITKPAELKQNYPEIVTILGVTDNRRAPNSPHWRVVGT